MLALSPPSGRLHLPGEAGPTRTLSLSWHDTAKGELARAGLALVEQRLARQRVWQVWRIDKAAPAGLQETLLAEALTAEALPLSLPALRAETARFRGRICALGGTPPGVTAALLTGQLAGGGKEERWRQLRLAGPAAAVAVFAARATETGFTLAAEGLGAAALRLAGLNGHEPRPEAEAADAGSAFAALLARLLAQLSAAAAKISIDDPEPVHQMRILVRRLRSALTVFAKATRCPETEAVRPPLKTLAQALAQARDWDVFVHEAAMPLTLALAEDTKVAELRRRAEARRRAAYRALARLLAGPEFHRLTLALALLAAIRPWTEAATEKQRRALALPLAAFAAAALERRWRPLARHKQAPTAMTAADRHRLRLRCKRLRYACEFFAPLFAAKAARRFLRRLTAVQDRLGTLNDAAAAEALLALLGATNSTAGGALRGFLAARAEKARRRLDHDWQRWRRLEPFWH